MAAKVSSLQLTRQDNGFGVDKTNIKNTRYKGKTWHLVQYINLGLRS